VWVWSLQAQPSCQQDGHERERLPKIRVGKAACGHHRAWAGVLLAGGLRLQRPDPHAVSALAFAFVVSFVARLF